MHSHTWRMRIVDTLVGFPILFLLFSLLVGGFANAAFILLVAVVCTLGVSLVVILPLAWAVGMITNTTLLILRDKIRGARGAA